MITPGNQAKAEGIKQRKNWLDPNRQPITRRVQTYFALDLISISVAVVADVRVDDVDDDEISSSDVAIDAEVDVIPMPLDMLELEAEIAQKIKKITIAKHCKAEDLNNPLQKPNNQNANTKYLSTFSASNTNQVIS